MQNEERKSFDDYDDSVIEDEADLNFWTVGEPGTI